MEATAVIDKGKIIMVRAVLRGERKGFYGLTPKLCKLISNGEEFECYEKDFSDAHRAAPGKVGPNGKPIRPGWMERVEDDEPVVIPEAAEKRGPGRPRKEI